MVIISHPLIIGIWDSLRAMQNYFPNGCVEPTLESFLTRTASRGNKQLFQEAIEVLSKSDMVSRDNLVIKINTEGVSVSNIYLGDTPPPELITYLLKKTIIILKPSWVYLIKEFPINRLILENLPTPTLHLLRKCGLLEKTRMSSFWWKEIINDFKIDPETSGENWLKGELYVFENEKNRLRKYGLDKEIRHCSKISDAYGYDILSFAGEMKKNPKDKIMIEVKTSSWKEKIHFHMTRNEWETMKQNKDRYYIYYLGNFPDGNNNIEILSYGDINEAEHEFSIGAWMKFKFTINRQSPQSD